MAAGYDKSGYPGHRRQSGGQHADSFHRDLRADFTLATIRDTLLILKLISGELRVSNAEKVMEGTSV